MSIESCIFAVVSPLLLASFSLVASCPVPVFFHYYVERVAHCCGASARCWYTKRACLRLPGTLFCILPLHPRKRSWYEYARIHAHDLAESTPSKCMWETTQLIFLHFKRLMVPPSKGRVGSFLLHYLSSTLEPNRSFRSVFNAILLEVGSGLRTVLLLCCARGWHAI